MPILRQCENCGAEFETYPSINKRHCSRACSHGTGLIKKYPKEASSYWNARDRCTNTKNQDYSSYGGRGIEFRFKSFKEFFEHIGPRPKGGCQLDRIQTNGHYEVGNVRWVTSKQNQRNRRTTKNVCFRGITKPLGQWSEELGISYSCLLLRLRRGWSVEKTLTTPVDYSKHPTYLRDTSHLR